MLDRAALALLRPVMVGAARVLVRAGVGADAVTWLASPRPGRRGGHCAAAPLAGLALLLLSRLCDGLDGAVAR
jgi:phosphatidylglycerophosphate synthase